MAISAMPNPLLRIETQPAKVEMSVTTTIALSDAETIFDETKRQFPGHDKAINYLLTLSGVSKSTTDNGDGTFTHTFTFGVKADSGQ